MIYAAKCYWPGVTEHQLEQAAARAVLETATASRTGSAIAYLGSILFENDELVLCLFDAASRAAGRTATERAGIPCERVMDSRWLPPNIATKQPSQEISGL
jgi:Nickel responsive protein SCO4226-like